MDDLRIIEKTDSISWKEISDLLNISFKTRADNGLKFVALTQDAEKTKQRVGNGICFVALLKNKIVGTATLNFFNNKKWYISGKTYGYISQIAVHPEYRKLGIGRMLTDTSIQNCLDKGVNELVSHSSINAKDILYFWCKTLGAQKVELLSSLGTNYYSVRLRLSLNGKNLSRVYANFRFALSYLFCVSIKKRDGKYRKGLNPVSRIIKYWLN